MAAKKSVLVPIADGSEEIETTCITDTLTRFGADVTVASVQSSLVCTMSRGIKILADCTIAEAAMKEWDLIALPGGMPGAEHLRDSKVLIDLLKKQKEGTYALNSLVRSTGQRLTNAEWLLLWFTSSLLLCC
jgi:protein deglycase